MILCARLIAAVELVKVEVVLAWPRRKTAVTLELPEGARVADALNAAQIDGAEQASGLAVFGVVAMPETPLVDGDRIELLRPLLIDPKEARRRRAARP